MTKLKLLIMTLGTSVALLSGCVTPLPTTSGNPEVIINQEAAYIRQHMLWEFPSNGFQLLAETPHSLTFSLPIQGSGRIIYQLAMGNAYSSPPVARCTFTLIPLGAKQTKIFAYTNISMTGAFGQDQGLDMTKGKMGHEVYAYLLRLKDTLDRIKYVKVN